MVAVLCHVRSSVHVCLHASLPSVPLVSVCVLPLHSGGDCALQLASCGRLFFSVIPSPRAAGRPCSNGLSPRCGRMDHARRPVTVCTSHRTVHSTGRELQRSDSVTTTPHQPSQRPRSQLTATDRQRQANVAAQRVDCQAQSDTCSPTKKCATSNGQRNTGVQVQIDDTTPTDGASHADSRTDSGGAQLRARACIWRCESTSSHMHSLSHTGPVCIQINTNRVNSFLRDVTCTHSRRTSPPAPAPRRAHLAL